VSFYLRHFSLLQNVQTGPGAHPASYSMGKMGQGALPVGQSGSDTTLTTLEVKNEWSNTEHVTAV
jgi:hypothetical protein